SKDRLLQDYTGWAQRLDLANNNPDQPRGSRAIIEQSELVLENRIAGTPWLWLRGARAAIERLYPHPPHQRLHVTAADLAPLGRQKASQHPCADERELQMQSVGLDPIRDIQVLCPMNRAGAGARSLNIELQAALNPAGDRKVERFGWTFAPGDKMMQIENDYDKEVYNGDIGTIDDVDANAGEIVASFDGRSVTYGFGELDMLVPAYAATIHKSQGSEYPAVIIPVLTQHYPMLQRNLLYTGVTRGKKLVVLVGQKKAVAIAVRNVSGRRRWS